MAKYKDVLITNLSYVFRFLDVIYENLTFTHVTCKLFRSKFNTVMNESNRMFMAAPGNPMVICRLLFTICVNNVWLYKYSIFYYKVLFV